MQFLRPVFCVIGNLCLALATYSLCRLVFFLLNRPMFPDVAGAPLRRMFLGGVRFDLTAVLYTNLPYFVLAMLPLRLRERCWAQGIQKALFVTANFAAAVVNLCDTVYFPYTGRRTTATVFQEFGGESNLAGIFVHEALSHWYLVLLGLGILAALILLFRSPKPAKQWGWKGYLVHTLILLALLYPYVVGIRGGVKVWRPISLNDANPYCSSPVETGIVLNTPFSLMRTIGDDFPEPVWMGEDEARAVFDPVHEPAEDAQFRPKNVVIFVLESFSASYSQYLTRWQGKEYEGYMPFLDSLMQEGLTFRHSFAHERQSICALSAILAGLPTVKTPYILSPYANDHLEGLVTDLVQNKGYHSSFWHGCPRASLGITGFARTLGFQELYNMEEFGDDSEFDGLWGIWDEPFLQFFEQGINHLPEPFVTSVFTVSSHHPFHIPPGREEEFPEGRIPMHKCIRYADNALRLFFEKARKEPWYDNTLFVFTGDHCNEADQPEYHVGSMGRYLIPIVFYAPDGSLKGQREGLAQQIDIQPTVFSYLGYDLPYVSFGCDLMTTPDAQTFAFNDVHGIYHYYQNGYLLQFDGERSIGLYDYRESIELKDNLLEAEPAKAAELEGKVKAYLQQVYNRIIHDRMTDVTPRP